jgi:hypothetical protein
VRDKKKQAKRERNNSPGNPRIAVPDGPKSKACKEEEEKKEGLKKQKQKINTKKRSEHRAYFFGHDTVSQS